MMGVLLIIAVSLTTHDAIMDVTRFDTMEECLAARSTIIETLKPDPNSWISDPTKIDLRYDGRIRCVPIVPEMPK